MQKNADNRWWLLGICWEMGYIIALPLVGFAFLGRFLDKVFGTSPLCLLIAMISAIALSTVLVVRKTTQVMRSAANEEGEERSSSLDSGGTREEIDEPSDNWPDEKK